MKIMGINGSPRRNWNTGTLIKKTLEGVASKDVETELINLYSLDYSSCNSCFYCKRKDKEHGHCNMNDDLSPILEKLREADGIVFGSPIYFMNISSGMSSFLERFLFSNMIYSEEIPTILPKAIPSAFIYTMNIAKEQFKALQIENILQTHQHFISRILQKASDNLFAYNTYQFTDYNKYESSVFSEENKAKYKKEQFPIDCENAFNLGVKLAKSIYFK